MSDLLTRLEAQGIVQPVDAALGRLLAAKARTNGEMIGLAAALASAALAEGHSCVPLSELRAFAIARAGDDAGAASSLVRGLPAIDELRRALLDCDLVSGDGAAHTALVLDAEDRLYLRRYYCYERTVAAAIGARAQSTPPAIDAASVEAALDRYFTAQPDPDQVAAVRLALRSRFVIISGGPGAGKTSTVLRLLAILIEQALAAGERAPRIALAAPTGKAAARLAESLRAPGLPADDAVRAALPVDAKTLHRLLGVTRGRTGARHRAQPLPYDVVVVDEASMLDLALAARLADALAADARLILLGDRDQLAAVETGRVFGALCQAASASTPPAPSTSLAAAAFSRRKVPDEQAAFAFPPTMVANASALSATFVELRGNHRFGAHSAIGRLASALRVGRADMALHILDAGGDEARRIDVGASVLLQRIVRELVPRYAGLAQASDANAAFAIADRFRALCALRETAFGAVAINAAIEYELRRRSDRIDANGWYAGRLVIVGGNDYRLGLFNGDIGVALCSGAGGALEVWFRNADGSLRALPPLVLGAVDAAYALTVHKAQGSEFDEVTVMLPDRDARVLTRELVYTAVTRARKKVELWTSGEVLTQAIARSTQRWSGLAEAVDSAVSRVGS